MTACDECRYSRWCHFRTNVPKTENPEDCSEYWKLEELWWEAKQDQELEENDSDYEDDDYEDEEEY